MLENYRNDAERKVKIRKQLVADARAAKADAAVSVLKSEIDRLTDALEKFVELAADYDAAYRAGNDAWKKGEEATRAFLDGTMRRAELEDVQQDVRVAQRRAETTRSTAVGFITKAMNETRSTDEAIRLAAANIEGIVNACASGLGSHWLVANSSIAEASAVFEPIFTRRALDEYSKRVRDRFSAQSIDVLRECLEHRERQQKAKRPGTMPSERIVKAMPLPPMPPPGGRI